MGKETSPTRLGRLKAAKLYAITCEPLEGQTYDQMAKTACEGGVDVLQFREKRLPAKQRFTIAARLSAICRHYRVLFIVNDELDIALAAGADGVHLGQEDLPLPMAKELLQRVGEVDFLIGQSTHSLPEALKAEREGADYIGVGPVFSTPTKPSYNPVGLELIRQVTAQVTIPSFVIGGIDVTNAERVIDAGAERLAVVRAVCGSPDGLVAAQKLKRLLSGQVSPHA